MNKSDPETGKVKAANDNKVQVESLSDAHTREMAALDEQTTFSTAALSREKSGEPPVPPPSPAPPLRKSHLVGLALSGGGIRSATFALGVLQALAAKGKLKSFDYLSTVSGGGYIGSWLSAWIYREGLTEVERKLGQFGTDMSTGSPKAAEPAEVAWLRRYSNYLAPRVGVLSFDSLTLLATWLRNVALNATVIFGFLTVLALVPYCLLTLIGAAQSHFISAGFAAAWFGAAFCCTVAYNLWHLSVRTQHRRNWLLSTNGVVSTAVVTGALSCFMTAIWTADPHEKLLSAIVTAGIYVLGLLISVLAVWGTAERKKPEDDRTSVLGGAMMAAAGLIGLVAAYLALMGFYSLWHHWFGVLSDKNQLPDGKQLVALLAFGPPLASTAFALATTVFTGMVGRLYFERSREWWSRLNAWLLAITGGWLAWVVMAFFSLPLVQWIGASFDGWSAAIGTGWIGSLLTSTLLRKPEAGSKRLQVNVDQLLNAAASIFVIGLLILVSAGVSWGVLKLGDVPKVAVHTEVKAKPAYAVDATNSSKALVVNAVVESRPDLRKYLDAQFTRLQAVTPSDIGAGTEATTVWCLPVQLLLLLASAGVTLLFSCRVDINKFSLHNMYKNRLIRCYLGASNQAARNEQPFTGLDDNDDLPLKYLNGGLPEARPPQRPLHIINTALNITQGSNLAWQERKAASFIFTPVSCGYSLERTQGDSTPLALDEGEPQRGYVKTSSYASGDHEEKGFTLGMALATSGAAVSPNMGHASSPARAFVLTLFNVRLGRWSPNSAMPEVLRPSPWIGLIPMLQELFGYSNERRKFVYLSDGGHFENLGLYELVRRRCRTIVVSDAGADPGRAMNDLAEAVRKCRVDFGVEIVISDLERLRGGANGHAAACFAKGTIRYNVGDRTEDGILYLLKPTLSSTRAEPADVLNYADRNPTFPQQTTADQFFDESQFEAYRRLGLYTGEEFLRLPNTLPDRASVLYQPDPFMPVADPPAWSTKQINRVRPMAPLPSREQCLVDIVCVAAVAVLSIWALRAVVDYGLSGDLTRLCFTTAACSESVAHLLSYQWQDASQVAAWIPNKWISTAQSTAALKILPLVARLSFDIPIATISVAWAIAACRLGRLDTTPTPTRVTRARQFAALTGMVAAIVALASALMGDFLNLGWTQTTRAGTEQVAAVAPLLLIQSYASVLVVICLCICARTIFRQFSARWL